MSNSRVVIRDAAVARAFYGSVVYVAVVTAFGWEEPQAPVSKTVAAVAATALLLYAGHAFADIVPSVAHAGRLRWAAIRPVLAYELPLLAVALVPLASLVVSWWLGTDPAAAYRLSVRLTLVILFALATELGRRNGLSWSRALTAGGVILVGTSIVAWLEALAVH